MQNESVNYERLYPYCAALAAAAALLVYLPALDASFLSWDDPRYVSENLNIRTLDLNFVSWLFTDTVLGNWHPLTMLSHGVDYALYGPNPFGHHLTSVVIHALNSALVFILTVKLIKLALRKDFAEKKVTDNSGFTIISIGFITALLFATHPLHVESVAWISERKDLLCAFFYILTVLSYIRYAGTKKGLKLRYALTLLLFLLALMSKPMAVTLPLVLIILDVFPLKRLSVKVLLEKAPFFLLSLIFSFVTIWAQKLHGAVSSTSAISLSERIGVSAWGYIFYIYKTIVPVTLAPLYPYPRGLTLLSFTYGGAVLLVVALTAISIILYYKRKPWFTAIWAYYLVTLLPVIGIVQTGVQSAADRYSYLPGISLFILTGITLSFLIEKYAGKRSIKTLIAVTLLPVALLSAKTVAQSSVWNDTITLWNHEIELYPEGSALAYNNRGREHLDLFTTRGIANEREAGERALKDFSRAIEMDNLFSKAFTNRGLLFMEYGELALAEKDLNRSIEITASQMAAFNGRGLLYKKTGRAKKALSDFTRAIELEPLTPGPYTNRGLLYGELGEERLAMTDYNAAITLDPRDTAPLINRGILLYETGRVGEALKDFTDVIGLAPESAIAYNNRGGVLFNTGKPAEAIKDLLRAKELDPTLTDAYLNLALSYKELGDTEQADFYYNKFTEMTMGINGTH